MKLLNTFFRKTFVVFAIALVSVASLSAQNGTVSPKPVDAKADDCVVRLKKFLADTYGNKIISGQMDLAWKDSVDMADRVFKTTGKYPALMGYDFMNYKSRSGDGTKQVEEAIAWWNKGGMVAFCWHWRDPNKVDAWADFYTEKIDTRIPYDAKSKKLNENSRVFKGIQRDLDSIAKQLKTLEDAGVPVLWRPLHEASGGWFWWGASGPDAYIALYQYMFTYFTEVKGLHNLIWVWNGQSKDWYPGDKYVDIIGDDIYANNYDSQYVAYNDFCDMSDDPVNNPKMVALTENGRIPNPADLEEHSVGWLWFMTWNDGNNEGTQSDNFWSGEYFNTDKHKKEVYDSEYVLTLDELPNLKTYPAK